MPGAPATAPALSGAGRSPGLRLAARPPGGRARPRCDPRRAGAAPCSAPRHHAHVRALTRARSDLEVADEPPGAAEAEPQAGAGAKPVRERQLDVLDARTVVLEGRPHANAAVRLHE